MTSCAFPSPVQICLIDDEHIDGTAWVTTRYVSNDNAARRAATQWLDTVRAVGAPVWWAMYRWHPDLPWSRV